MNKHLIIPGIAVLLITVGLSGCTEGQISDQSSDKKITYPIASASANPTSGKAPSTVNFTGDGQDNDGIMVSCYGDFDDGNTSNEQNTSHTFLIQGKYNVTFTVMDNDGNTQVLTIF